MFEGRGRGAHWATATKATNKQHYGRWLGYLAHAGRLDDGAPADRVTKDAVAQYNEHLIGLGTVAPRTRLSMLVGLKEVIRAMAPDRDWRWLQDACNHIQRNAAPSRDKGRQVGSSAEFLAAALQGLAALPDVLDMLKHRIAFRDYFMLALLATRPLRKKNFTWLELGRHVIRIDDHWLIAIPAKETKNRNPVEYWIPEVLVPWFERYLAEIRPHFPSAEATAQLWLSKDGPDLGKQFLYWRITKLTERIFGTGISPHNLRHIAVSTLALESPDMVQTSPSLLGHRHASTTARYYVQARNLEASRRINRMLERIKTDLEAIP